MDEFEERRLVAREEERRELAKAILLKLIGREERIFSAVAVGIAVSAADQLLAELERRPEQS